MFVMSMSDQSQIRIVGRGSLMRSRFGMCRHHQRQGRLISGQFWAMAAPTRRCVQSRLRDLSGLLRGFSGTAGHFGYNVGRSGLVALRECPTVC
jgi:hypothetical protein